MEWPDLMTTSSNGGGHCSQEYVSWSAEASSRLSVLDTSFATTSVDLETSSLSNAASGDCSYDESSSTTTDQMKSTSNAYQFVDLAAQINDFVEERERRESSRNLMPLDLTYNTTGRDDDNADV